MTQPTFISNQQTLEGAIAQLKTVKAFAIDLEFDKNHFRYGFQICLMQIFDGTNCYLIDPLSPRIDIKAIFGVLEDSSIQKVVFSFGEDMRLMHSLGCFPKNIVDTAVAARLADYAPASLGNMLEAALDIEVNKSAQASDWFTRPLTPKQIEYAASDVLHLLKLQDLLAQKVEELGRTEWLNQENAAWDELDYSDIDSNVYLKEKDKRNLSVYEWFVFGKLMDLREAEAQKLNRPSYKVLSKDYLLELAKRSNQIHRFDKIRGIHKKIKTPVFKQTLQKTLDKAIEKANQQRLSQTEPATTRLSEEEYKKFIARKKLQDIAKKDVFKPIQEAMRADLGDNVITLLINNRIMQDLAIGRTKDLLPYKIELIKKYATQLELDYTQYFQ